MESQVSFNGRVMPWTSALVVVVVALALSASPSTCNTIEVKTTVAPKLVVAIKTTPAAVHTSAAPVHLVAKVATAAPKILVSPTTGKPLEHSIVVKITHGTTAAPAIMAKIQVVTTPKPIAHVAATSAAPAPTTAAAAAVVSQADATTPAQRVTQYFEPVCTYLERLQPRQMFKIQSQMKQFVEKTAGKMSLCFLQHYSIDPNLTPVSKAQLQTICSSRTLDKAAKGSFEAFLSCTANNYDQALDAELARINRARASHTPNHSSKNDTLTSDLAHDDDELSLISEVVDKVMADSKDGKKPLKPDVTVIDLSKPVIQTTLAPGAHQAVTASATTASPFAALLANKKILHDPNTMILFVDDTRNATTVAPVALIKTTTTADPLKLAHSTAAPISVTLIMTTAAPPPPPHQPSTSVKPIASSLGDKIVSAAAAKTTAAPASNGGTVISKSTTVVTIKPSASTTAAPSTTSKPSAPTTTGKPAKAAATASTTTGPMKVIESVLEKQDSERSKLDMKFKKEREQVIKEVEKKTHDDLDAKKAIKALQAQRAQAHGSPSDARMHQIEHERQMTIDPVGHTIKHKEYELKKAALAGKSTTTTKSPTTVKPKKD